MEIKIPKKENPFFKTKHLKALFTKQLRITI